MSPALQIRRGLQTLSLVLQRKAPSRRRTQPKRCETPLPPQMAASDKNKKMSSQINETQIRAARELLRWDQKRLADLSNLSLMTVKRHEMAMPVAAETAARIVATLEKAGVLFINEATVNGIAIAAAVALRAWAQPDERPDTRAYVYKQKAGRPKGSKNKDKEANQK